MFPQSDDARTQAMLRLRLVRKFGLHRKPLSTDETERLKDEYYA